MRILAQFSGGLDSLGALCIAIEKYPLATYDLLFVIMKPKIGHIKWLVQIDSVAKILEGLRKIYPEIEFNLLTPEVCIHPEVDTRETLFQDFYSGLYGGSPKRQYSYILNGYNKEDCLRCHYEWAEMGKCKDYPDSLSHCEAGEQLIESFITVNKKETPIWRPVITLRKPEIYKLIPERLRDLTWGCGRPILQGKMVTSCTICNGCMELTSGRIPLNQKILDDKYIELLKLHETNMKILENLK